MAQATLLLPARTRLVGQALPDDVARALDELTYFTSSLQILGVYPANPFRRSNYGSGGI